MGPITAFPTFLFPSPISLFFLLLSINSDLFFCGGEALHLTFFRVFHKLLMGTTRRATFRPPPFTSEDISFVTITTYILVMIKKPHRVRVMDHDDKHQAESLAPRTQWQKHPSAQ
jgi:hypothetical protein